MLDTWQGDQVLDVKQSMMHLALDIVARAWFGADISRDTARFAPRSAYFPSGGTQRICIGAAFAMMQTTLLLATIAQRFHLDLGAGASSVDVAGGHGALKQGVRNHIALPATFPVRAT